MLPRTSVALALFAVSAFAGPLQDPVEWFDSTTGADVLPPDLLAKQSFLETPTATWFTAGPLAFRSNGTAQGTSRTELPDSVFFQKGPNQPVDLNAGAIELPDGRLLYGVKGEGLFANDGTLTGIETLANVELFGDGTSTLDLDVPTFAQIGGATFFLADDGVSGRELWTTDGTPNGTRLAIDFVSGPVGGLEEAAIASAGGMLYLFRFSATDVEVWASTGTTGGNQLIAVLGSAVGAGLQAVDLGDRLVFCLSNASAASGLYSIDGLSVNTVTGLPPAARPRLSLGSGRIFLSGYQDVGGTTLTSYDGNSAGIETSLTYVGAPSPGAVVGDTLLFPSLVGLSAWDGTSSVATQVSTLPVIAYDGLPQTPALVARDGIAYFQTATQPSGEARLVRTDGSALGTFVTQPIEFAFLPQLFLPFGVAPGGTAIRVRIEELLVDPADGLDLIRTGPGFGPWKEVAELAIPGAFGSQLEIPERVQDRALLPTTGDGPQAVWLVSDGTLAGTETLESFDPLIPGSEAPGIFGLEIAASQFTDLGGRSYFIADAQLQCTDLTPGSTTAIGAPGAEQIGRLPNGLLVAVGEVPTLGVPDISLWVSDGTAAGTSQLTPTNEPFVAGGFVPYLNGVVFSASAFDEGSEVWFSDGSLAGTGPMTDIFPGPGGAFIAGVTPAGNRLFFIGRDPSQFAFPIPTLLYVTDGGFGAEQVLVDGNGNPFRDLRADGLEAFGDRLVFAAEDENGVEEPWMTDGTPGGTFRLVDLAGTDVPIFLEAAGDRLFFSRRVAAEATWELWTSDGTAAGTALVRTVDSVPAETLPPSTLPLRAFDWQDRVVFVAEDSGGIELWVSDGTSAGTRRAIDLVPGPQSPFKGNLIGRAVRVGTRLVLEAVSPEFGREFVSIPMSFFGGWAKRNLGEACGATLGKPHIDATGDGTTGGTLELRVENAFPGGLAAFFAGPEFVAPLGVNLCSAQVSSPLTLGIAQVDSSGSARLDVPVANQPALVDRVLYLQGLAVELNGPFAGFATLTGALEIAIGE